MCCVLGLAEIQRLLESRSAVSASVAGGETSDGCEGDTERELEESEKNIVWERHLKRKARRYARHVLSRAMLQHEIPALFASRRSDGDPHGFHCGICCRDVSFRSHGEAELYSHFTTRRHYNKDRRYRFDHETAIFLPSLERVPVELVEAELVEEIRRGPPVVLGNMYPLPDDELGELAGVESRLPVETMMGTLLELFRSGGNHSLVRRVWAQFRMTLGESSPLRDVSWSKTEIIVSVVCF